MADNLNIHKLGNTENPATKEDINQLVCDLKQTKPMPDEVEMVSITKKEYDDMIEDQQLLQALQSAGVDNWEGYDMARESMDENYY